MSDFLKKLKSVFVVEDSNSSSTTPTTNTSAAAPKSQPTTNPTPAPAPTYVPPTPTATPNNKIAEMLFGAMEAGNLPGFDYLEFMQSVKSLSSMPMDEATRFRSAFAMAQTMGVTAPKLIETAQHYLGILQGEQKKFGEAMASRTNNDVTAKEQEIANLDSVIKNKAEQIKQLTEQIQSHQNQMDALRQQINEATGKVETAKNDFVVTYNSLVNQINADIENMKNYLKS